MIYTRRIQNFEGYELSQEFDCSETGAKEAVILSGNNNGGIIGVKTYEYIPAVKEKLVEVYSIGGEAPATYETIIVEVTGPCTAASDYFFGSTVGVESSIISLLENDDAVACAIKIAAATWPGFTLTRDGTTVTAISDTVGNFAVPKGFGAVDQEEFTYTLTIIPGTFAGGSKQESILATIDVTNITAGSFNVFYGSAVPVAVSLIGSEDSSGVITAISAAIHTGYTIVNFADGMGIGIICNTPEDLTIPISITDVDSGVVFTTMVYNEGVDATGGGGTVTPGDIEIFYNSEEPVIVEAEAGDTVEDVYDKIIASAPVGYTATSSSNISIECDVGGAKAIPLSIDLGTTGITVDSTTLTEGVNEAIGAASTVVVKTQRTIDSRARIDAGLATWIDVDTAAAGVYTEEVFAHPVSAVRINCTTAEDNTVARLFIRTAE